MHNYYENTTHLSTSFLKGVLHPNRTFPKSDALSFGQMVDTLLSEHQALLMVNFDLTTAESLNVTEEALELAKVYIKQNRLPQNPKSRYQWEIYKTLRVDKDNTAKFRGKTDHWLKGVMVEDYKTTRTAPTTKAGFENLLDHFDYDMQACMYSMLTGEKDFWFSFLCRTKQTLTQLKASQTILSNGAMKIKKAFEIWQSSTTTNP